MEEKQQAICALREFSADTGAAFHPFLQTAFEAVWKVIDFPDEDIRRSAVDAVTQFAIAYYKAGDEGAKEFATRYGQLRIFFVIKESQKSYALFAKSFKLSFERVCCRIFWIHLFDFFLPR